MIIRRPGQAAPGVHLLGHPAIPCYLIDAPRPVVVDAGVACLAPAYLADAKAALGGRGAEALLLTHSHFDHCGAAAPLARELGGAICAHPKAAATLERPNARELIARLNQEAARLALGAENGSAGPIEFEPFTVERMLEPDSRLELGGGEELMVLAAPGHTWDMLAFYLPARRTLFCSEAAGCPDARGAIVTEFLVDYDAYLSSLRRLAALEVEVLCHAHHGVYTGADAADYLARAPKEAERYRQWVEELLEAERGEVERVVAAVKGREYDPRPGPKQPLPAYLINTRARVEHLKERMARG